MRESIWVDALCPCCDHSFEQEVFVEDDASLAELVEEVRVEARAPYGEIQDCVPVEGARAVGILWEFEREVTE